MNKCPFCNSENVMTFGRGEGQYRSYQKIEVSGTTYKITSNSQWSKEYYPIRYLCRQCGMIHEKLNEDDLKALTENQQYEK